MARKRDAAWLAKAPRGHIVPPFIEVEVRSPRNGRPRPFAIPTDTSQAIRGLRADGGGEKQDVRAEDDDGGNFVNGTACALLARDVASDTRRYLLGCHHVLRRSLLSSDATPVDPDRVVAGDEALGSVIGSAPFGEDEPDSVDAALVRLTAAGIAQVGAGAYWRTAPSAIVASAADLLALKPGTFSLYPRCSLPGTGPLDRVRLRLLDIVDRFPITYKGGGAVTIREVAVFEPLEGETEGGYSGAPVVIGGKLVGMHIAGDFVVDDAGDTVYRCAAIPAYVLLEKGLLVGGDALRLAALPNAPSPSC